VPGAGTAGAAAALFLARAGHTVTVLEAVERPGPVGAGIVLQPTGQGGLAALGLLPTRAVHGEPLTHLVCHNEPGRPLFDLSYHELSDAYAGLGLHRGVLVGTLFDALTHQPRLELRCGLPARQVTRGGGER
jgi:2-polyprenyl-6-methoxyphenol hydroxylase-like FAD-dependent oxidoreductase